MAISKFTKEQAEGICRDCGHAININNGRCARIEDALCQASAISLSYVDLLEERAALLAACIAMRRTMYSETSEESVLADAAIAKATQE